MQPYGKAFLGQKRCRYPSMRVFRGIFRVSDNLINLPRQASIGVTICQPRVNGGEIVLMNPSFFFSSFYKTFPTPALKCNTPKVILNTLRVFSITPKVLEQTLVASALMVAIANIKGNNCEH